MPLPIEPWANDANPRDMWRPSALPPRRRAPRPDTGREPRWSFAGTSLCLLQPWYGPILLILAVAAYLFGGGVPTGLAVLWAAAGLVDAVWAALSVLTARAECRLPLGPFTAGELIPVEIAVDRPSWLSGTPLALAPAPVVGGGRRGPRPAAPVVGGEQRGPRPAAPVVGGEQRGPRPAAPVPRSDAGRAAAGAVGPTLDLGAATGVGAAPWPAAVLRAGAEDVTAVAAAGAAAATGPRGGLSRAFAADAPPPAADPRTLVLRTTVQAVRGRRRVGALQIGASGPFGVAGSLRRIDPASEMLVLPRLHRLPPWPAGRGGSQRGPSSGRPPGDAGAVLGVRPLQEGDPLRRVHWKRSAATATWQVKRLEPEPARPRAVVLDLAARAYAGGGRDLADRAVELAAAAAAAQADPGRNGAVWLHGTSRRPIEVRAGAGAAALRPLLEALAEAEPDGRVRLGEWLRRHLGRILPRGGTLVLVTPQPPAAWIGALLAARPAGVEAGALLLVRPGTPRAAALEACGALQQAGISAWAVEDVEDLAGQLALGGGRSPRGRAEA